MRVQIPNSGVLPIKVPVNNVNEEYIDPCRCDDDRVDWRKILRELP